MRKLIVTSQELKALYPPMSDAFNHTVQNTLYDLTHGKEQPKVKKKISVALVFAVVLILVTISAAIALTQSNLLGYMFGGNGQAPEELEEIVSKPGATVTVPDVTVTLNEYLYDGEKLHLYWTIVSQTDRQIMVTMTPFMINGMKVNTEGVPAFQSDTVHGWGQILGGEVDGLFLPGSMNYYSTYVNPREYMQGYYTFAKGEKLELTSDLYIWELLSAPDLVIPDISQVDEGFLDGKAMLGIPTDRRGVCGLGWLYFNDNSIDLDDTRVNQSTYERKGWARVLFHQPVQFSITLDTKDIKQAKPVKTSFETDCFTLNINRLAFMSTGGTLVLHVEPKAYFDLAQNGFYPGGYDFVVLDADTKELLGSRMPFVKAMRDYTEYTIELTPVLGEMPRAILIVPALFYDKWDKNSEGYDLNPNNDCFYKYDMDKAVKVELEWQ